MRIVTICIIQTTRVICVKDLKCLDDDLGRLMCTMGMDGLGSKSSTLKNPQF
jgi:hypothetical protein